MTDFLTLPYVHYSEEFVYGSKEEDMKNCDVFFTHSTTKYVYTGNETYSGVTVEHSWNGEKKEEEGVTLYHLTDENGVEKWVPIDDIVVVYTHQWVDNVLYKHPKKL